MAVSEPAESSATAGKSASTGKPEARSENPEDAGRKRIRRACYVAIGGAAAIGLIQWLAPEIDYQYAFFASAAVGVSVLAAVSYQLHRVAAARGHRFAVPALWLVTIVAGVSLVKIRTFTGEVVPQLQWRFADRESPPLVTDVSPGDPAGTAADVDGVADPGDGDAHPGSPGFLGPRRDGVIPERRFAVPESDDEAERLWEIGIGPGWGSFAIAGQLAVTLEQRGEEECVTAYRVTDGTLRWIHRRESRHESALGEVGPRSTPFITGGKVYTQGATGIVSCLTLGRGEPVWEQDLLRLGGWAGSPGRETEGWDQDLRNEAQSRSEAAMPWGRAGSPLVVDGLCVVPFGGPTVPRGDTPLTRGRGLIAFDAETGEPRWTAGDDQISYASPQRMVLGGQEQIVIVNEASVSGHAIDDGRTLWTFPWPGQSNASANCASAIPAGGDRFLVGKGYAGGSALVAVSRNSSGTEDRWDASAVWTSSRLLQTKFNHAVIDGDLAFGISNGALEAVRLSTQESLWKQSRRERSGQGQLLLAGDVLVVQAESGEIVFAAADPAEYRPLGRLSGLGSKTWNIPALGGRLLLIRNDTRAIAYRLPPRDG